MGPCRVVLEGDLFYVILFGDLSSLARSNPVPFSRCPPTNMPQDTPHSPGEVGCRAVAASPQFPASAHLQGAWWGCPLDQVWPRCSLWAMESEWQWCVPPNVKTSSRPRETIRGPFPYGNSSTQSSLGRRANSHRAAGRRAAPAGSGIVWG